MEPTSYETLAPGLFDPHSPPKPKWSIKVMIDLFHCVLKFPKLLQEPFKADTNLENSLASGREEIDGKFCTDFPNYVEGLIQSEPGNYVTTPPYTKAAQGIYNMNLRPDDVFVMSFPKCGKSFFFRSFKYIFSIS